MLHASKTRFLAAASIITVAAAGIFAVSPVVAQSDRAGATYRATLSPLNGSGAQGEATLTLTGRTLNVRIQASGLEAGGPHISHIHGLSSGNRPVDSRCPSTAQDEDNDGFVELLEGLPAYGPILVDFMNIDPDEDGTVDFTTSVQLSRNAAAMPLNKRHIVVHGMSVGAVGAGTPGEVDGTPGYKLVLPVLCGEIGNAPNSRGAMNFRSPSRS